MNQAINSEVSKIGIFYDGGFFFHVSNYYNYIHERKARLSINGIHDFIRKTIADAEGKDVRYCQIVDSHYFRGRLSAYEADTQNKLLSDRLFDDVLMKAGVTTHYLPLNHRGDKGVEVWMAIEVLELAYLKQYDSVVLLACDSDFVPLVRKLNARGIKVMVLGWDFKFFDEQQREQVTTTSQMLLEEVTYPILMNTIIDDKERNNDPFVNGLFVQKSMNTNYDQSNNDQQRNDFQRQEAAPKREVSTAPVDDDPHFGNLQMLRDGYGFISTEHSTKNIFFHWSAIKNRDFNELSVGDKVEYYIGQNEQGQCAVDVHVLQ